MSAHLLAGPAAPPADAYDADIIILTLDRVEETLAAIASARRQTGLRAHIFVLDQGSSPDGLAQLRAVAQDSANVTLLAGTQNLGVAGGRNLLSGLGHGRVIIGLDNDATFATPDTAASLVRALDAEPRLAAIGCRILTGRGETDDLSSWGYPASLLPCAGDSFDAVTFVGAGHAIRRAAWDQVGGYDPALFFCWEEYDFCLRAIALGWGVRYRGDIAVHHAAAAERRVAWTGSRWFYVVRNRLYIERKQDRTWLRLLPRISGYLVKGARNGLAWQTIRAIQGAACMGTEVTAHPRVAGPGRLYLQRNDRAHRGSILRRIATEVLVRPAGVPAGAVSTVNR